MWITSVLVVIISVLLVVAPIIQLRRFRRQYELIHTTYQRTVEEVYQVETLLLQAIMARSLGDIANIIQAAAEMPGEMGERLSRAYVEVTHPPLVYPIEFYEESEDPQHEPDGE